MVTCPIPVLPAVGSGILSGPPTIILVAEPPALVHMVLAQLLTVLAEISDAGTPHRKEPVEYDEAGPSGPLWGPVRLTCATCFQVALN